MIPELVGTWTQDSAGQPSGNFLRSAYIFQADGTYALLDMLCFQDLSGVTCDPDESPESGVATVNGDMISFTPTTASDLGPRAYPFRIEFDEVTGYNRLQFFIGGVTDEWFWLPPN